jgi:predicted Rossmann-fold nucleotide-binding protein
MGNRTRSVRYDPTSPPPLSGSSMREIRTICVYCGSGNGTEPAFVEAAVALGRALAETGIGLVYGGGNIGLMGTIAHSVLEHGGQVHTRKRLMFERADAFVALPGGIGTLEELVEQMTWAQLGQHTKPILMLSVNGFWRPLLQLFAHMRQCGFIRAGLELNYLVAEAVEDVIPMLAKAAARRADTTPARVATIEQRF